VGRHDTRSRVGPAYDAGGRSAEHHGDAPHHRRRRRGRRVAPRRGRRASARPLAHGDVLNLEVRSKKLEVKAANIKLILLDVDGVLTDGAVVVYGDGSESKRFHIRDGIALVWAQRAGIKVGLLSARHSPTTAQRAAQLGITLVHQGVASKLATYDQVVGDMVLSDE